MISYYNIKCIAKTILIIIILNVAMNALGISGLIPSIIVSVLATLMLNRKGISAWLRHS